MFENQRAGYKLYCSFLEGRIEQATTTLQKGR
jgi:hypothetical protein